MYHFSAMIPVLPQRKGPSAPYPVYRIVSFTQSAELVIGIIHCFPFCANCRSSL